MKPKILVVDDETSMREFLDILLTKEGYDVVTAADGQRAVEALDTDVFDVVITDLKMPKADGIQVLKKAKSLDPESQVLVITAFASHDSAVEAMKAGALDYIVKPFKVDEVRHFVAKALERRHLSRENIALRQQLGERYGFGTLIGSDPRMLEVYELVRRVADTPTNVLITGETGTGKELVARAIHVNSSRSRQPFVVVNCGAIPGELLESELFGHKRGSFTGAIADKKGLFEIANGGTLFLDEVGELPAQLQVKLLRALQERIILPVGANREIPIDVRVVSATNRDVDAAVAAGRFREDLYYRLNVIQIAVPPLRDRRNDIPMLAAFFLEKYARLLNKPVNKISEEAMSYLRGYHYPGNVRELENIIERAVALEREKVVMAESLPPTVLRHATDLSKLMQNVAIPPGGIALDDVLAEIEKNLILEALKLSAGGKKAAAQLLGVTFRSFRYRVLKLNLAEADGLDDKDDEAE
jgi:two-component system response regulator PilR (NtrC family)